MKKNLLKKLVTLAIAGTMIMSTGVVAFASEGDTTSLETHLYKDGKYDPSDKTANLSMGDGAVEATTYVEKSDGTYTATFHFKSSFTAYGLTGHLTYVDLDVDQDGEYGGADDLYEVEKTTDGAVVAVSFNVDSIPTVNELYNMKFQINVVSNMPIPAEGDMVVLPGVTGSSN